MIYDLVDNNLVCVGKMITLEIFSEGGIKHRV